MIKHHINNQVYTFHTRSNKRQRRIIIKPIDETSFQVSMPKYTTKKTLIKVIEENESTLLKMKPQISLIDHIIKTKKVLIFGMMYTLEFTDTFNLDITNKHVTIPVKNHDLNSLTKALKRTLKEILLAEVMQLEAKYKDHFSLEHVKYRMQYITISPTMQEHYSSINILTFGQLI
ncbi:MAG: YgjP-like metallopeptidase domain-containing protein, partial [Candidatus Izemoplasmataceae bacterium]